ncbi:MAG: 30S ribosomal protein S6 [Desulfobacteraceae bacterium]|jgi:small subunit ribosomal protein S6
MRRYETIVIVDADVPENDRVSLFNRIQEIIPQQQGVLIKEDLWGVKKLAYEIKKKPRGYYARYDYCGMGPLVDELERFFRIDDRVLKYLTVLLDPDADAEKILAELEASETGAGAGDETPPQADEASPAGQETATATETTESATETSKKE